MTFCLALSMMVAVLNGVALGVIVGVLSGMSTSVAFGVLLGMVVTVAFWSSFSVFLATRLTQPYL
jgi:TctA family transporter